MVSQADQSGTITKILVENGKAVSVDMVTSSLLISHFLYFGFTGCLNPLYFWLQPLFVVVPWISWAKEPIWNRLLIFGLLCNFFETNNNGCSFPRSLPLCFWELYLLCLIYLLSTTKSDDFVRLGDGIQQFVLLVFES